LAAEWISPRRQKPLQKAYRESSKAKTKLREVGIALAGSLFSSTDEKTQKDISDLPVSNSEDVEENGYASSSSWNYWLRCRGDH
jgi:hypothetical protein